MNTEEEYALPSEPQINTIIEQNAFQQEINQLVNKKNWDEKDIQIIVKLLLFTKPSNYFNTKSIAMLFEKFCITLKYEIQFLTSILANMQEKFFSENDLISDIHVSYMRCCIETFNYKLGYKFIKKRIIMPNNKQDKNVLCEYFFYAGLICQSQRLYEDALNYYQITSKLPVNSIIKKQASKLELLLLFRLGRQLKGSNDNELALLQMKLQSIQNGEQNSINEEWLKKDEDVQLSLKECQQQSKLLGILQKEREIHLKVSLQALISYEIPKDQLIQFLIEINNIEDMFLINEEKDYLQFKNNNLNFTQINKSLENKLDLLQKMLN